MTPALGAGACPAGSSPAGFGVPASTPPQTVLPLLKPDGTPGDAVALDPTTGDYLLDGYGNRLGCDSVQQQVYLALQTQLGSCVVQDIGLQAPGGTVTPNLLALQRQAVVAALSPLTDVGIVQLISVQVQQVAPGSFRRLVKWRATSTGQTDTTIV